jgi:hypothetical protein
MKRTRAKFAAASLALVVVVLLAVSALAAAGPSLAKGSSAAQATAVVTAPPSGGAEGAFLTINPLAGFPLDPFLVTAQGGGPVAANTLSKNCTGYIPAKPTVTVDYKSKADVLKAFFYSDGDTTLVIQTPDGKYICGDDTNRLVLDPTVEINKPAQGRYNVWVGSAAAKDLVPGFLVFTARADMDASKLALGSLVKRPAAPELIPVRDRLVNAAKRDEEAVAAVKSAAVLKAGGQAVTKDFTASGELPAVELQTGDTLCGGLVNVTPDYAFDWSGDAKSLSLLVESNGDTTLLVRAPDGSFLCADDADGSRNLNPLLAITKPAAGRYLVWVGRVDPSKPVTGTLTLTEAADAKPKALKKQ